MTTIPVDGTLVVRVGAAAHRGTLREANMTTRLTAVDIAKIEAGFTPALVTGDEAMIIMRDVVIGISPQESELIYHPGALEYRARIEEDIAKMPPGTEIAAPDL